MTDTKKGNSTQADTILREMLSKIQCNTNNDFSNESVASTKISTQALKLVSLSPKYKKMNITLSLLFGIAEIIALSIAISGVFFEFPKQYMSFVYAGYVGICLITAWKIIYHYLADPLKLYALREHDMNYQSGLFFKSLVSQPILRIQHIEIKRGPIERKYGLASLQVFSAGGASYTFYIPGLEYENAVQLRQFILDHSDLAADV